MLRRWLIWTVIIGALYTGTFMVYWLGSPSFTETMKENRYHTVEFHFDRLMWLPIWWPCFAFMHSYGYRIVMSSEAAEQSVYWFEKATPIR
jgi:hypothetical protein